MNIYLRLTGTEADDVLDDMDRVQLTSLDSSHATDALYESLVAQMRANRVGEMVVPTWCAQGVRNQCTARPRWRVREKRDSMVRNWVWTCDRHLAATCKSAGEHAELDVVRAGI